MSVSTLSLARRGSIFFTSGFIVPPVQQTPSGAKLTIKSYSNTVVTTHLPPVVKATVLRWQIQGWTPLVLLTVKVTWAPSTLSAASTGSPLQIQLMHTQQGWKWVMRQLGKGFKFHMSFSHLGWKKYMELLLHLIRSFWWHLKSQRKQQWKVSSNTTNIRVELHQ